MLSKAIPSTVSIRSFRRLGRRLGQACLAPVNGGKHTMSSNIQKVQMVIHKGITAVVADSQQEDHPCGEMAWKSRQKQRLGYLPQGRVLTRGRR